MQQIDMKCIKKDKSTFKKERLEEYQDKAVFSSRAIKGKMCLRVYLFDNKTSNISVSKGVSVDESLQDMSRVFFNLQP